ncbi:MAG: PASTA domain-containing protein [Acidobacteriota bacterium]|nr:PASTA domain-containing protein [Acidobacteriota bacterium]MDQ3373940.1 PASTA domain-containing protein [Acidobacteriota bacterium]
MSFIKQGASAFGKLFIVAVLAGTFLAGAAGAVYLSLQGEELKVPEIVGKDLVESEKELAALGLRIKRRADRFSTEKPNTILEQLPKPGDTVKTGQMILVVVSKTNPEGDEAPVTLKKSIEAEEADDSEKIEELISDKPKKSNKVNQNTANTNKKKVSTTRDVIKEKTNSDSNSDTSNKTNSNSSESSSGDKTNKNASTSPNPKPPNPANSNKSNPTSDKMNAGDDVRPRKTPKP